MLRPIHHAFQSLAPGTGPALGIGDDSRPGTNTIEWISSAKALISADGSYFYGGSVTVAIPGVSIGRRPARPSNDDFNYRGCDCFSDLVTMSTYSGNHHAGSAGISR